MRIGKTLSHNIACISTQIVAFLAIGLLMASTTALAEEVEGEGHLTIFEVSVDYDDSSMLIIGIDLDFGPKPLKVILGDTDITGYCTLDDPQTISCAGLTLPVAADLLLIVSNGNGAPSNDEYDLTFGAVGPQGDQGEQGKIGPPGEDGADGGGIITRQGGYDLAVDPVVDTDFPEDHFHGQFDGNTTVTLEGGEDVLTISSAQIYRAGGEIDAVSGSMRACYRDGDGVVTLDLLFAGTTPFCFDSAGVNDQRSVQNSYRWNNMPAGTHEFGFCMETGNYGGCTAQTTPFRVFGKKTAVIVTPSDDAAALAAPAAAAKSQIDRTLYGGINQ